MTERRILGWNQLRNLCINNGWCDLMDVETYNTLLEVADSENVTTENIFWLSVKIYHGTKYYREQGLDSKECIEDIAYEIGCKCVSTFAMN